MPKLRFLKARGYAGQIARVGAVLEVDEFWANQFIADGTAELADAITVKPPTKGKAKNVGKSKS
jgi:hypothetical protein